MKKKFFITFSILTLLIICIFFFNKGINRNEANNLINEFFTAVKLGDYETAETYLHPERPASLEDFFLTVESQYALDFQSEIDNITYIATKSVLYDSTVNGSTYEVNITATVDNVPLIFWIEIVHNHNGLGIYNLTVNHQ